MYHAGSKRNEAAGAPCAQIYQFWYWRYAPRLHAQKSPHIPYIYTCQCGCPYRSQRETWSTHRDIEPVACFPLGLGRMEARLTQYCTSTYIYIYIYPFLQASTPLVWKMTGLLLPMTRGDWFPTWLLEMMSPLGQTREVPGQGGHSLGGLHLGSLCILVLLWASANGLVCGPLGSSLAGDCLAFPPTIVCLLICECADKLYHIILQYWTISKWKVQCKSNFLMFFSLLC